MCDGMFEAVNGCCIGKSLDDGHAEIPEIQTEIYETYKQIG